VKTIMDLKVVNINLGHTSTAEDRKGGHMKESIQDYSQVED
jgi:hypothetical protein